MDSENRQIDEFVKDRILRYPTRSLVELIFPSYSDGKKSSHRNLIRSPFRDDRTPSFSFFKNSEGVYLWHDFATEESGNNITLFRKCEPSLSYVEAVDALAQKLFGTSAFVGVSQAPCTQVSVHRPVGWSDKVRLLEPDRAGCFSIKHDYPIDSYNVPESLREYWRSRAISDETMKRLGCRYFILENSSLKGRDLYDSDSGSLVKDDGLQHAVGMYNDIGGVIFRTPDSDKTVKVHKGGTNIFISTFLAGGGRPLTSVWFVGNGTNRIHFLRYDVSSCSIAVNSSQCFQGIRPDCAPFAMTFLSRYVGEMLDERLVKRMCAVLNSLNAPMVSRSVVVEGMYDGLSLYELRRWGQTLSGGSDLVILNGVANMRYAVPFLCMHSQVDLMLDNDERSRTGQNTSRELCRRILEFNASLGYRTEVRDVSAVYGDCKDLNEALMVERGLKTLPTGKHGFMK